MAKEINPKYNFLLDYFVGREGEQILDSLFEVDLINAGLLDSLDILELAILIEDNTGVKLDFSEVEVFDSMRSVNSIISLLEK